MNRTSTIHRRWALTLALLAAGLVAACTVGRTGRPMPDPTKVDLRAAHMREGVEARTKGCVSCHTGQTEPHPDPLDPSQPGRFADLIGCTDCHGGDAKVVVPAGASPGSPAYLAAREKAHVLPKHPERWPTAANPELSYTAWLDESWEFVRFVNPGDLRVAALSCGSSGCHGQDVEDHVRRTQKSMMAHGGMLWSAALYNNGAVPFKQARFGESYGPHGEPQRLLTDPPPTPEEVATKGVLPFLDPLPRFEVGQPSNILRIFERGQRKPRPLALPLAGLPGGGLDEEPGRPQNRLSDRGLGTLNRVDPVWLNLQRTRLLDPTLNMLGTNDHPGDYRSSGCSACHVVYANDRDPLNTLRGGRPEANHSGPWSVHGNRGKSAQPDPTIPKDRSGHPIAHLLTRQIPSSQCIVCHMHPGTAVSNTYLGYTWWDLETDGQHLWPKEQVYPSAHDELAALKHNPEGSTPKGLWRDREFLAETGSSEFNAKLDNMQLGDFHGHGFLYRAVWKRDARGNLLDEAGEVVAPDDPERWKRSVHLKDIHLERGMHCADCHFTVDSHGDGKLYGELRAATAIRCEDCHGTVNAVTNLMTTGNAGGQDLRRSNTPFGARFRWDGVPGRRGATLFQRSSVVPDVEWEVPQVKDSIDPAHGKYSEKARVAKTMRTDHTWGDVPADATLLAHASQKMECYTCHTAWVASCFGCHLDMKSNQRREALHYEGSLQRNWTSYSFQTLREDIFMLGRDGDVSGGKVVPVRSACAVTVGSQTQDREFVYSQQQTVSAEGFSGTAFSPHVPHTVRTKETRSCTNCHVSKEGDNNAQMAQALMVGTNAVNFLGRYVYVASGAGGFDAVAVTERTEPQAVIGSRLHELAYPDDYGGHVNRGRALKEAYHHAANTTLGLSLPFGGEEVRSVQLRGEYLYTANGPGGLKVYDVAQIDHKGFSQRITWAPTSPLGQRLQVKSKDATSVRAPSTQAVDPTRAQRPENREQKVHPLYAYLYVTDREEGLILVSAATLLDGDPTNNFLERAVTYDAGGLLKGAESCAVVGEHVYVVCDAGLVVVSVADPLRPQVVATARDLRRPRSVEVQLRYAFVCDDDGVAVLDVTDLLLEPAPTPTPRALTRVARVPLTDAQSIYISRSFGYVAAGKDGLVILDLERPAAPKVLTRFDGGGWLAGAKDVKVGATNASLYAYVAAEKGLAVVQLTSADDPRAQGWSPVPSPRLIATYATSSPALAISEGVDRDRAVDEHGHQTAVFGRIGSRPLTRDEMRRLLTTPDGKLLEVTDGPPGPPRQPDTDQPPAPSATD
ncbi:MAG: hypothetical protein KIT58_07715, partial [Planctomycetota bacterium]|nr:hypothetical protein [Planctomycetota bacterium]